MSLSSASGYGNFRPGMSSASSKRTKKLRQRHGGPGIRPPGSFGHERSASRGLRRRRGDRRGSGQARLLRTLCAAAPRPGVRRHRDARHGLAPSAQGRGARLPGVQGGEPVDPCRQHRDRPHALLDDGKIERAQRPAVSDRHAVRSACARAQRQHRQRACAQKRAPRTGAGAHDRLGQRAPRDDARGDTRGDLDRTDRAGHAVLGRRIFAGAAHARGGVRRA